MKNKRLTYGLLCSVIALILLVVGVPMFISANTKTTDVVRVTSHITKGELITEDMVEIASIGSTNLPSNVATELKDVVGKYAVVDFLGDETVLKSHVNDTPLTTDLSALPQNKVAVSFTVQTFAAGVSDKLLSGDIIRILRCGTPIAFRSPSSSRIDERRSNRNCRSLQTPSLNASVQRVMSSQS